MSGQAKPSLFSDLTKRLCLSDKAVMTTHETDAVTGGCILSAAELTSSKVYVTESSANSSASCNLYYMVSGDSSSHLHLLRALIVVTIASIQLARTLCLLELCFEKIRAALML